MKNNMHNKTKFLFTVILFTLTITQACAQVPAKKETSLWEDAVTKGNKLLSAAEKELKQSELLKKKADVVIEVNQKHRFELSPCEYKYNGKVFRLGGDIQELIDVFGPYDRHIDYATAYVWDHIGFGVLCHHQTEKTVEMSICFDCCEWTDPNNLEGTLPKHCFQGGIIVDGIPFGNGLTMLQFNHKLDQVGSSIKFNYWKIMKDYNHTYDCDYDEVKSELISEMNHCFLIRPNSDTTYSMFTISDSREHNRLEREAEVLGQQQNND